MLFAILLICANVGLTVNFNNDDVGLVIVETGVLSRRRYPKTLLTLGAGRERSGPRS